MPNETVRIAVGKVDASLQVNYGPIAAGTAGNSYVVIVDYVRFQTSSLPVEVDEQSQSVTILAPGSSDVAA